MHARNNIVSSIRGTSSDCAGTVATEAGADPPHLADKRDKSSQPHLDTGFTVAVDET